LAFAVVSAGGVVEIVTDPAGHLTGANGAAFCILCVPTRALQLTLQLITLRVLAARSVISHPNIGTLGVTRALIGHVIDPADQRPARWTLARASHALSNAATATVVIEDFLTGGTDELDVCAFVGIHRGVGDVDVSGVGTRRHTDAATTVTGLARKAGVVIFAGLAAVGHTGVFDTVKVTTFVRLTAVRGLFAGVGVAALAFGYHRHIGTHGRAGVVICHPVFATDRHVDLATDTGRLNAPALDTVFTLGAI